MTLEQQVANLVSATTDLTNVVNDELNNVRTENNTFKSQVLSDIDTRFTEFIQGFDEVKFVQNGFTVYVAVTGGSASPQNPVNNQAEPFNTINNAYNFLLKYYWTAGSCSIHLLPGTHTITTRIDCIHPCLIRIVGANIPTFTLLHDLLEQTTNANREAVAATPGSNASLLIQAKVLYQSILEVDIPDAQECAFVVYDNLHISDLLIYQKNLGRTLNCIYLGRFTPLKNPVFSCGSTTFMYFNSAILSWNGVINFQRFRTNYFLGNVVGINNNNTIFTNKGEVFYCNGNTTHGANFSNSIVTCTSGIFSGNGQHGIFINSSNMLADAGRFVSNGGNGLYQAGGTARAFNAFAQNNSAYGYRCDSGVIYSSGSDVNTTGNISGKKLENNAQQGYVIGVNP